MFVRFHNSFKKAYKKRVIPGSKLDKKVEERLAIFRNNPSHPILREHSLKGKKIGLRAFSVTGDIRVVYLPIDKDSVLLLDIGKHNQVY